MSYSSSTIIVCDRKQSESKTKVASALKISRVELIDFKKPIIDLKQKVLKLEDSQPKGIWNVFQSY